MRAYGACALRTANNREHQQALVAWQTDSKPMPPVLIDLIFQFSAGKLEKHLHIAARCRAPRGDWRHEKKPWKSTAWTTAASVNRRGRPGDARRIRQDQTNYRI